MQLYFIDPGNPTQNESDVWSNGFGGQAGVLLQRIKYQGIESVHVTQHRRQDEYSETIFLLGPKTGPFRGEFPNIGRKRPESSRYRSSFSATLSVRIPNCGISAQE